MTAREKANELKDTITYLYTKEGRTISYIARLLEINRTTLAKIIDEWGLGCPGHARHMKPSTEKFLNKHKQLIKKKLDEDCTSAEIEREIGASRGFIRNVAARYDSVIRKALDDNQKRVHEKAQQIRDNRMKNSTLFYDYAELPNEEWRDILGFPKHQVSNFGRIRSYSDFNKSYHLLTPNLNKHVGRYYISLTNGKERKTMQLARVVAHAFCEGFSEINNTVNHKDGDPQNNIAENLEWVSQSENNKHAYRELGRSKVRHNKAEFTKVVYKDIYEFKTVSALARFIGMSDTQTRRYLEEPEKHDLKIIP